MHWLTKECLKKLETVSESKAWQSACCFPSSCFESFEQFVKMKRMALIPEELLNRYEQRQRLEMSSIMADVILKDTQMLNIFSTRRYD